MPNPSPTITFRVKTDIFADEKFGPNTNLSTVSMLHPDRHQTNQDNARVELANRITANTRSLWLQQESPGSNRDLRADAATFTLYGSEAIYVRKMYASGTWNDNNPQGGDILEIVS